ncbi:carboxypeptidase B [Thecamonas trahens ATCC 50062]|uniref:Carboxypeptidase B n=1 Tax=Thecamonas trahens ATCC 50062 TaxID=461836 RepID=A0A0L0DLD7_THETB|nr:carboxypeptidase B [Thecamonas trahens ATCC 50062]KNC52856.1 carboxypeptidase B [Thecamonas trahens ATCC 50062]|eukprot:XP_013754958.1 carboxypeptidase B [Thecamonas trahens ATCC 50062]
MVAAVMVMVLVAAAVASAAGDKVVRYDDEVVLECQHGNATGGAAVRAWAEEVGGDVWAVRDGVTDVRVTGAVVARGLAAVAGGCRVVVDDLQALVAASRAPLARGTSNTPWFNDYHTYDEIAAWFAELAAQYPERVSFQPRIGESTEGRALFAVRISAPSPVPVAQRPQIYLQALQHAREWIGGAVIQYIAQQLATTTETALLEAAEFVLVPVVNPDGYAYTWTTDRLWRKTRYRNADGSYGIDANRNWDDHWGGQGSSSNPRSDTYHGPAPFAAPETLAVSDFILQNSRIVAAYDLHAYSQLILGPYGWTHAAPPHAQQLQTSGNFQSLAIEKVHGKKYVSQPSVDLYPTTGSAGDWFYGQQILDGIGRLTYGFTLEARPASANPGFLLPPNQIIPTGEEVWAAIQFWASYALENPL